MKNLNKFYIKQKESELKKLEEKALNLEKKIQEEESTAAKQREDFKHLQLENNQLKSQYHTLKNMLIGMGILFDIENNNYNFKEWDNLYLKKKGNSFLIVDKSEDELKVLEKDISIILQDIFDEEYSCSLIIIRVLPRSIKVQMRFIAKEK
jgi:hypothetical protein